MRELSNGLERPVDPAPAGEHRVERDAVVYEPPRLRVVGTLAKLTRGNTPTSTDGLNPGSALG